MTAPNTTVLVLGGGPDAERAVSLDSAAGVAAALRESGRYTVVENTIDRITLAQLRALPGDLIFPVLHGSFGEGGPLQDILEQAGRPYVGSGPAAARLAMDKIATKLAAASLGIPTAESCVLNLRDEACPLPFPVVVKPVHEGSSVGLHLVHQAAQWPAVRHAVDADARSRPDRTYMVERLIPGTELTVGLIDNQPLPTIHIQPADGPYDYEAKYHRDDTRYILDPPLPQGVDAAIKAHSVTLARAIGVRHVARVDFLLDRQGRPWLLELNTMPGFTSHSLVPKASRHAGRDMPALCAHLADLALRDFAG
ncbi:MAG: D-alanine--D-alanine ligase [Phycisphaerales bacterium]|nr:D-alanine--D-alanine ligase [Phycisphaerales bacterium]